MCYVVLKCKVCRGQLHAAMLKGLKHPQEHWEMLKARLLEVSRQQDILKPR